MTLIDAQDSTAVAVTAAIHQGDIDLLRALLESVPSLAGARIGRTGRTRSSCSLLHVATDWPGHFPRISRTIAVLVASGADVDARFDGRHRETALHWAASSNDVDALTALLDAGADVEADGGVIADGTPLRDATAFGQWDAARALVARGAHTNLFDLASLGMLSELRAAVDAGASGDEVDDAFWAACHGGQLTSARLLHERGAAIDRTPPWGDLTPLDCASRAGAYDVMRWLHGLGASTSAALRGA